MDRENESNAADLVFDEDEDGGSVGASDNSSRHSDKEASVSSGSDIDNDLSEVDRKELIEKLTEHHEPVRTK